MTLAPQVVKWSDKEGGKVPRSQQVQNALSLIARTSQPHVSQGMIHQPNKHNDVVLNHIMK